MEAVLTSTHNLCFEQKYEKYQNFLTKNFHFLLGKFSVNLNRRVFVMGGFIYGVGFVIICSSSLFSTCLMKAVLCSCFLGIFAYLLHSLR